MAAPSSKFYGKIWVGFCRNTSCVALENAFCLRFYFKANRKSIGTSTKQF